jgi:manganese/iron transport system substrate-binding protein
MSIISRLAVAVMSIALPFAGPAVEAQDKFKAVTTFTVIADMAQNVAGDAAVVESITKPGAEIHNYQPTPGDLIRAQDADLILWNGLNLELWFERFFQNLRDIPGVVVSEGVEPMGIAEGPYSGKPNPHAWMSPSAALIYVDNIARAFAQHDPANAETYMANAEAYKTKIEATIEPIRQAIASVPEERRWLATSEGLPACSCRPQSASRCRRTCPRRSGRRSAWRATRYGRRTPAATSAAAAA